MPIHVKHVAISEKLKTMPKLRTKEQELLTFKSLNSMFYPLKNKIETGYKIR